MKRERRGKRGIGGKNWNGLKKKGSGRGEDKEKKGKLE